MAKDDMLIISPTGLVAIFVKPAEFLKTMSWFVRKSLGILLPPETHLRGKVGAKVNDLTQMSW